MVRPFGSYCFTRGITTVTHLFESQHHDPCDLRRAVHDHDVVSPLPTTSYGDDTSEAFDGLSITHENLDSIGYLGHHPGTIGSRRPRIWRR